ncbi:hypothetical protein FACS1894214_0380 [Planctomycetales bacterium]|nr:hypothetical protein FACS1894214_0380 [Planctomycetales bacterium]
MYTVKRCLFGTFLYFVCSFFICSSFLSAQEWSLKDGYAWARDKDAVKKTTVKENGKDVVKIEHTGKNDWALSESKQIPVKFGDVIELNAELKAEGTGSSGISVITRKKNGDVVNWSYGKKDCPAGNVWTNITSKFIVPQEIETIEPRIAGHGTGNLWMNGFTLKKTGQYELTALDAKPVSLSNEFLDVQVFPAEGTFSVKDKRTGRTWTQSVKNKSFIALPKKSAADSGVSFSMVNTETLFEYNVSIQLEKSLPELSVKVDGNGVLNGYVQYPAPFVSQAGDRLIIPLNEGISYPVEKTEGLRVGRLIAYGGHGICMTFWGQIEDKTGSGMTAIIETADDASIDVRPAEYDGKKMLQVNALWEPSLKEFRYPRSLRYVFHDKGGHVAVCKRYREYAKKTGIFKPFTEKVKQNPNIDKLLGAANIWYMDGKDRVKLVKEMQQLGMERILWSGSGGAEQLAEMNKLNNVLTSRYDIYQDIMDPAQFEKVGYVHGDWTTDAWPHDINWAEPDGTWRKGWQVDQKDKTQPRIPCAVICDAKAVPYARKRISKELETKPFTCRFIDTTVAAPWFECYHPDHPMSRSDSKKYKMELLKLIGDLGLVCGSETGHDASVPFCDFYEGMLSLGPYRVNESGRDMVQIIDEVPPQISEFQVNPVYRLPLWELVYHDCVVAQWYWGDYNNKLPKVWRQRDLFNALYGTPPMYMFTQKNWDENKQKFAESYKTAAGTARATAYAEMTEHRILSDDRLVQQTVFSNGVVVTVNFGEKPFKLPDGSVIGAEDWHQSPLPKVGL